MKKFIQISFIIILVSLFLCGCNNPFSESDEKPSTTEATTTEEVTTQGNSEIITLETTTTTKPKKKELVYYSDNIGASFILPVSWENKYAVEDIVDDSGNKSVSFFEKDIHRIDGKGLIFSYNLFLNKSYTKNKNYTEYGTVTNGEGITYYMVSIVPNSSQYDEKNKNLKKAYEAISKDSYIADICNNVLFNDDMIIDKEGCSTMPSTTEGKTTTAGEDSSKPDNNTESNGLVFADISTRVLSDIEIQKLSSDQIQQAINDICAIHGYNFTTPEIKAHYQQFDWYKPSDNFSEASFNDVEKRNYDLLQHYR